jgi:hypothetical protein
MIQTGRFLTSTRRAFTKDMVQVILDDDNLNHVKRSDISKCKHKDRFDLSDIRKPSENKNHLLICKPTKAFTSICESQPHEKVLILNNGTIQLHDQVCIPDTFICTNLFGFI